MFDIGQEKMKIHKNIYSHVSDDSESDSDSSLYSQDSDSSSESISLENSLWEPEPKPLGTISPEPNWVDFPFVWNKNAMDISSPKLTQT